MGVAFCHFIHRIHDVMQTREGSASPGHIPGKSGVGKVFGDKPFCKVPYSGTSYQLQDVDRVWSGSNSPKSITPGTSHSTSTAGYTARGGKMPVSVTFLQNDERITYENLVS